MLFWQQIASCDAESLFFVTTDDSVFSLVETTIITVPNRTLFEYRGDTPAFQLREEEPPDGSFQKSQKCSIEGYPAKTVFTAVSAKCRKCQLLFRNENTTL